MPPGADLRGSVGGTELYRRYGKNATVMINQLPTDEWYGCVGDNTLADAILDRLMQTPTDWK
ncbi:ATP-binding protein [Candidatus Erwinia dacicola]